MSAVVILTLLSIAVTAGLLYLLFNVMTEYNPGKRKVQADLKKMKDALSPYLGNLVPINKEELELFSLSQIHQLSKKRTRTARGVYTTIFHEPIMAYSYKRYLSSKLNAVLYARTANHEFAFRIQKGEVKVVIDNVLVGTIRDNNVLYSVKDNRMIARINRAVHESYLPVLVNDREVAQVAVHAPGNKEKLLSSRAFAFVKSDLSHEEEKLLLSMSILELVNRELG